MQRARARDRGHLAGTTLRIASWAATYAVAIWLGHLTLVEPTAFALFWPASGVALVWMATSDPRTFPFELALLGLVGGAAVRVLDGTIWEATEALVAVPASMVVFVALTSRWTPGLWAAEGIRPIATLRQYGALVGAAVAAGITEGLVALVVLTPDPGLPFEQVGELTITHSLSIVTIGGVGVVLGSWFAGLPAGPHRFGFPGRVVAGIRRDSSATDVMTAVLAAVATAAIFVAGYVVFADAPVSFVLVMAVVGVAIRFSAPTTAAFGLAVVTAACWLTAAGEGPIAGLPDPHRRSLAFGLFALAVAVTGLTIAISRSERDSIIGRLQESERAAEVLADDLTLVLANLDEGVAVVDESGRFIHANAAIGRLLEMPGFNTEQGEPVEPVDTYHLAHADGRPLLESEIPHVRAFAGEEDVRDVLYLNRPDVPGERIFEVSSRVLPQIRAGDLQRAVTTIRDVTSEHQQRDALAEFAQVVAHDLRSPLTSVQLWAQELLEGFDDGPVDRATGAMMLGHIESAANRMQNFITDLLSYALARDQTPSPVKLELNDVVEGVVETIAAVEGVEPEVEYGDLPGVWCDPVLAPQLFDNLIGNARKYVADGVVPQVRIEATPLDADWIRVSVIDNGIGIAAEDRLRVFETFERAHAAEYEGTGLGLAICRHIVERHGGTIAVTTPPEGTGTCIELTLPLTDSAFDRATVHPDG